MNSKTYNPDCDPELDDSQDELDKLDRPPATTEPAESEGKMKQQYPNCPTCGDEATYQTPDGVWWDGNAHYWKSEPPTAPPAESVEDAKEHPLVEALTDLRRRMLKGNGLVGTDLKIIDAAIRAVTEREQYATKHLERQTPAIVERFIEEVEEEVDYLAAEEDIAVAYREAMQIVKARRSGAEK